MKQNLLTYFLIMILTLRIGIAQDSLQFLSATSGAASFEVEYENGYLYGGSGSTLQIFDVSNVNSPPYPMIYSFRYRSIIDDIKIRGDFLYIAANHDGVSKWDISNPQNPVYLYDFKPSELEEAAYDISFLGDSLFVGFDTRVVLLWDNGNLFQEIGSIPRQSPNGTIRGGDLKDSVYAFVEAYGGNQDGVYLVNAYTLDSLSFFSQTFSDPENLLFGKNTDLLHVLGGGQVRVNPLSAQGLFYSLDISDPLNPILAYEDTLDGIFLLGIAAAMNGEILNDTIYIATQAAMDINYQFPDPFRGHLYAYDVTDPDSIEIITSIDAGLWHFDLAFQGRNLHVASEWFGIETTNLDDIMNPNYLGRTLTGGWNWGSAAYGNTLIVAQGGYGFKKFDITDKSNPVLVKEHFGQGFCKGVSISPDGKYLYGFYLTGDSFRIFDLETLDSLGAYGPLVGDRINRNWGNLALTYSDPTIGGKKISILDVTNPAQPLLDTTITGKISDMLVDENGKLFISKNGRIDIHDMANFYTHLVGVGPGIFKQYGPIAKYKDTLFAYVSNQELMRLIFSFDGTNYHLKQDTSIALPFDRPKFLAADSFGVYVAYVEEGLYAFNKRDMIQTGFYRHGLGFLFEDQWGLQDVFCQDEYIYLTEFFGQTTILTNDNGKLTSIESSFDNSTSQIVVFPNPVSESDNLIIDLPSNSQDDKSKISLDIVEIDGRKVLFKNIHHGRNQISIKGLAKGLYIYLIKTETQTIQSGKLVIE